MRVFEGCRGAQRKWLHSNWTEGVQLCIQEAFHVRPVVWLVFYRGVLINSPFQQCSVPILMYKCGVGSFAVSSSLLSMGDLIVFVQSLIL